MAIVSDQNPVIRRSGGIFLYKHLEIANHYCNCYYAYCYHLDRFGCSCGCKVICLGGVRINRK